MKYLPKETPLFDYKNLKLVVTSGNAEVEKSRDVPEHAIVVGCRLFYYKHVSVIDKLEIQPCSVLS